MQTSPTTQSPPTTTTRTAIATSSSATTSPSIQPTTGLFSTFTHLTGLHTCKCKLDYSKQQHVK